MILSNNLKIGYYVHHIGDGHRQRAIAIAKNYPKFFTLIGTNLKNRVENLNYLNLLNDICEKNKSINSHLESTHYTPYNEYSITHRMRLIADWIDDNKPALIVSDVSVEVAMLARLFATPTIYVRLHGDRSDTAHMDAFLAAEALLCPFAEELELQQTAEWVKEKSYYFANLTSSINSNNIMEENNILVLLGAGGNEFTYKHLLLLASELPLWNINVLGTIDKPHCNKSLTNLHLLGWKNNYISYIQKASVIIGSAGDGVVSNILNFKKPYICVPQKRPFNEQLEKAKMLSNLGIDVISDLNFVDWKKLIASTIEKGNIISKIDDNLTAQDAADFLVNIAKRKI